MKIGFIGAGKVGRALGIYFHSKGLEVTGYNSLDEKDAIDASTRVLGSALSLSELVELSDIIFITVNDDHIESVAKAIVNECNPKNKIFAHTSGAHSSHTIDVILKMGGTTASIHPLQSFADVDLVQDMLPDTAFSVEGIGERYLEFKSWMSLWTDNWFEIKAEDKGRYHMAAAIVSNYLVSVLNYGIGVMESIGLSEKSAIDALKPLIDGSIKNVYEKGKVHSLTGPISRGDIQTIENHLSVLEDDEKELYKMLGLKTLDIAREKEPELKMRLDALEKILK